MTERTYTLAEIKKAYFARLGREPAFMPLEDQVQWAAIETVLTKPAIVKDYKLTLESLAEYVDQTQDRMETLEDEIKDLRQKRNSAERWGAEMLETAITKHETIFHGGK